VLPLRDLSPDAGSFTGDGMTESLITELGRIRALRVISHQSVLRFRDSPLGLREIGEKLGVDAIIEGSVLEVGGRVRITVQLVRVEPEEHLWADAFDADAEDVLSVHRDVARAVARSTFAALSVDEERELAHRERVDPAAYEAFLQGWMKHASILPDEMVKAKMLYERAIALDPTFAPPRANLATMTFALLCTGELSMDAVPAMLEAVDHAIALDPTSALGYGTRGLTRMTTHDWRGAEEDLLRAVALAPNSAQLHTHLVMFLTGMGRFGEAAQAAQRARHLDPLAPHAHWIGAWANHYAGRPREAVHQLQHVLDLFPDHAMAWIFLAKCHYQLGDREETIRASQRSRALLGENPMALAYIAHMLAQVGARDDAEQAKARFDEQRRVRGFHLCFYAAVALCGLGRTEEALDELDQIDAAASANGWLLPVDPLLDPLRNQRRFKAVLQRIGLSER
jgi:TolB-like protein/Tfp pilus assembly protein PilF